jgi:phosphoglycolate phosphatase-like HAD superfamily hydrolase
MEIKELKRLKDEFFVYVVNNLFLKPDLKFDFYSRDYAFILPSPSKSLYLDADGVLNADEKGISTNYYDALAEENSRVKARKARIGSLIGKITELSHTHYNFLSGPERVFLKFDEIPSKNYQQEFDKTVAELEKELIECNLKEGESSRAVETACKRTKLVTNLLPTLRELEEMGFDLWIVSSGPYPAIKRFGEMLHIPHNRIKASELEFKDGNFFKLRSYAGINKKLSDKSQEACVFVTDDYRADFRIASTFGLGLVSVTGEVEKFPGKIYVKLPELRKDFTYLPEFVRRYEIGRMYARLVDPKSFREACERLHQVLKFEKLTEGISSQKEKLKENLEDFLRSTSRAFPEESYHLHDLLNELEFARDTENLKKVVHQIVDRMKNCPLKNADEKFLESMKFYEKEWKKYEGRISWNGV